MKKNTLLVDYQQKADDTKRKIIALLYQAQKIADKHVYASVLKTIQKSND